LAGIILAAIFWNTDPLEPARHVDHNVLLDIAPISPLQREDHQ
jgi:hypothetical protein